MPDDLHDFGAHTLGELLGGLAARQQAAVLNPAFDELVGLQGLFGLLGDRVGDVRLSDQDDGVEMVREGAKLTDLFAGKGHVITRFLLARFPHTGAKEWFLQVNDTALGPREQAFTRAATTVHEAPTQPAPPRVRSGAIDASYVSVCVGAVEREPGR